MFCVRELPALGGEALVAWESVLSALELPACGGTALSPWEKVLTEWGEVLAAWGPVLSAQELPASWGKQCYTARPGISPVSRPSYTSFLFEE